MCRPLTRLANYALFGHSLLIMTSTRRHIVQVTIWSQPKKLVQWLNGFFFASGLPVHWAWKWPCFLLNMLFFLKNNKDFLGLMQVFASAVNVKIWYLYFELLGMYHFVNLDFRYQTTQAVDENWKWEPTLRLSNKIQIKICFVKIILNPSQSWRMQLMSNEKNEKRIHFSVAP